MTITCNLFKGYLTSENFLIPSLFGRTLFCPSCLVCRTIFYPVALSRGRFNQYASSDEIPVTTLDSSVERVNLTSVGKFDPFSFRIIYLLLELLVVLHAPS